MSVPNRRFFTIANSVMMIDEEGTKDLLKVNENIKDPAKVAREIAFSLNRTHTEGKLHL